VDPGCLSRIPDPDFNPSWIPDPITAKKDEGKKIWCPTFFVATPNYFISEQLKIKKFDQSHKELYYLYLKKCHCTLKNMGLRSGIRDTGSGKNLFRISDRQHWKKYNLIFIFRSEKHNNALRCIITFASPNNS
jgi:hypothetical protein